MTKADAEAFLIHEAELLDELRLDEWLKLFTADGIYWVPLDETMPVTESASIIRDTSMRREERVFHILHTKFPAQSPRSRTLHMVSNVRVREADENRISVLSNQVVHEVRTGDFRQTGLGVTTTIIAQMQHLLEEKDGLYKIHLKKILLLDRDMPQGNLTFLF
jgi:3-phenylpropionate/cinnamic acid dioxygenase small subunit